MWLRASDGAAGEAVINLPNLITLARLFAAPVVVWLMLDGAWTGAFGVFVFAGLSDAVDGLIARRFRARSRVGGFLDPLADKTMLVSVFVMLGYTGHLPAWLVILVVFRDLIIIGGAILVHTLTGRLEMHPLMISKINTVAQFVLPVFLLARLALGVDLSPLGDILVYTVAATTTLSGAAYVITWSRRAAAMGDVG
jgi:cardiolipin synthase